MKSQSWINKVALGHVNGLAKAFGLEKKSTNKPSNPSGGKRKYVQVLVDSLWVYNKADWNAKDQLVHKNVVFTIKKIITVSGSKMHQLKSGMYITDNPQYVRVYKK